MSADKEFGYLILIKKYYFIIRLFRNSGGNDMNSRTWLKESWIVGILGILFFFFSNVTYTIPLATWLAPIFLICFVRTQTKVRG